MRERGYTHSTQGSSPAPRERGDQARRAWWVRVLTASRRIVEDDAERVALARPQAADAVAHRYPVGPAGAFDRPVVDRENDRLALLQWHDFAARLRPRPLLDEQELAAGEVLLRLTEQHGQLQREHQIAVQVLVQAVVVAGPVFEQERRRPLLPGFVTLLEIGGERGWKPPLLVQPLPPAIGNRREMRVDRLAQSFDRARQRIPEILILAAAKSVTLHYHATAKYLFPGVERGDFSARFPRQQLRS